MSPDAQPRPARGVGLAELPLAALERVFLSAESQRTRWAPGRRGQAGLGEGPQPAKVVPDALGAAAQGQPALAPSPAAT